MQSSLVAYGHPVDENSESRLRLPRGTQFMEQFL